jgi:hypothetical protein
MQLLHKRLDEIVRKTALRIGSISVLNRAESRDDLPVALQGREFCIRPGLYIINNLIKSLPGWRKC